jgi:hypothetical protein
MDCLVCIEPCTDLSKDLFLYSCICVYPIHPECFKDWRRRTNTDRVCLICQESLDPHSEQRPQQLMIVNPGIDRRLDEHTRKICIIVMFSCIVIAMYLIVLLIIKHALQLPLASFW